MREKKTEGAGKLRYVTLVTPRKREAPARVEKMEGWSGGGCLKEETRSGHLEDKQPAELWRALGKAFWARNSTEGRLECQTL